MQTPGTTARHSAPPKPADRPLALDLLLAEMRGLVRLLPGQDHRDRPKPDRIVGNAVGPG